MFIIHTVEGIVECSESLGPTDCSSVPTSGYWLLNLEGNGRVAATDDASNWTVAVSKGLVHFGGSFRDIDNNLQQFNCPATGLSWLPDGPHSVYVQQPGGQQSIFYIDGPGTLSTVQNNNPCAVGFRPIDSMTWWENFKVTFTNKTTNVSRSVPYNVKLIVAQGRNFDTVHSMGQTGWLPQ